MSSVLYWLCTLHSAGFRSVTASAHETSPAVQPHNGNTSSLGIPRYPYTGLPHPPRQLQSRCIIFWAILPAPRRKPGRQTTLVQAVQNNSDPASPELPIWADTSSRSPTVPSKKKDRPNPKLRRCFLVTLDPRDIAAFYPHAKSNTSIVCTVRERRLDEGLSYQPNCSIAVAFTTLPQNDGSHWRARKFCKRATIYP